MRAMIQETLIGVTAFGKHSNLRQSNFYQIWQSQTPGLQGSPVQAKPVEASETHGLLNMMKLNSKDATNDHSPRDDVARDAA